MLQGVDFWLTLTVCRSQSLLTVVKKIPPERFSGNKVQRSRNQFVSSGVRGPGIKVHFPTTTLSSLSSGVLRRDDNKWTNMVQWCQCEQTWVLRTTSPLPLSNSDFSFSQAILLSLLTCCLVNISQRSRLEMSDIQTIIEFFVGERWRVREATSVITCKVNKSAIFCKIKITYKKSPKGYMFMSSRKGCMQKITT